MPLNSTLRNCYLQHYGVPTDQGYVWRRRQEIKLYVAQRENQIMLLLCNICLGTGRQNIYTWYRHVCLTFCPIFFLFCIWLSWKRKDWQVLPVSWLRQSVPYLRNLPFSLADNNQVFTIRTERMHCHWCLVDFSRVYFRNSVFNWSQGPSLL